MGGLGWDSPVTERCELVTGRARLWRRSADRTPTFGQRLHNQTRPCQVPPMTLTPRPREPEFADTSTDRAALVAILNAAGRPHGDDLEAMNAEWDGLAPTLVQAKEDDFDHWSEAVTAATAKADKPVRQRVSEIIGHLIGWRIGDV